MSDTGIIGPQVNAKTQLDSLIRQYLMARIEIDELARQLQGRADGLEKLQNEIFNAAKNALPNHEEVLILVTLESEAFSVRLPDRTKEPYRPPGISVSVNHAIGVQRMMQLC